MNTTNESLLRRVRDPKDARSWREFATLYGPVLKRYARARGLRQVDAEDVAQEVMSILVKRLPSFEYCRRKGRFSGWLRKVANNQVNKMLSKPRPGLVRSSIMESLRQSEAEATDLWERIWLRQHLSYCLVAVREEFAPNTFDAFRRVVLDEWPVPKVCAALGMNRNQVYLAKSRVLRRVKERMVDLVGFEA